MGESKQVCLKLFERFLYQKLYKQHGMLTRAADSVLLGFMGDLGQIKIP